MSAPMMRLTLCLELPKTWPGTRLLVPTMVIITIEDSFSLLLYALAGYIRTNPVLSPLDIHSLFLSMINLICV